MDKTVAELNIVRFRKMIAKEEDEAKRKTLEKLLAEEEAKLSSIVSARKLPKAKI